MRNFAIGFALAAAVFAAIGVAYAAIPHSQTNVITACVGYIAGGTRIIDAEAGRDCLPWERKVEWSANGAVEPDAPPSYYTNEQHGNLNTAFVLCDEGDIATGGGVTPDQLGNAIADSSPSGAPPEGWNGIVSNLTGLTVYVVCLDLPPLRP